MLGGSLVYTWASGKQRASTRVKWTLVPEGSGTRLVLEHTGFRGVGGFLLRGMMARGWGRKLQDVMFRVLDGLDKAARQADNADVPGAP